MTTREALHHLVDELPEQAELARVLLEDLRDAADEDGHRPMPRRLPLSIGGWLMLRQVA
jgi:hypothetical protein